MPRNDMTEMYYPNKLIVEEFIQEIEDHETNLAFINNMHHLEISTKYPEDWIKTYAAWMEMND